MQNRLKSKTSWVAVAALVLFILKTYGLLGSIGLTDTSYKEFTTLIFGVVAALGVFNDPTNKDGF